MAASPKAYKAWKESSIHKALSEYHQTILRHDRGLVRHAKEDQIKEQYWNDVAYFEKQEEEEEQQEAISNFFLMCSYGLILVLFLVLAYTVWLINEMRYPL